MTAPDPLTPEAIAQQADRLNALAYDLEDDLPESAALVRAAASALSALAAAEKHPLMVCLNENKCGDAECEDSRLNAAFDVLRGIKTSHKANAELVYHTEQAWADAAGTEHVARVAGSASTSTLP